MQEFDPQVLNEPPIPPPEEFSKRAHVRSMEEYEEMRAHAERDPEGFWGEQAKMLHWFEPPKKILEWDMPHAKWFVGGKLNVSDNCLDRHLEETSRPYFGKQRTARRFSSHTPNCRSACANSRTCFPASA